MNYETFLSPLTELNDCSICPRNCHSDRFSGRLGYCGSDSSFNIASICIHRGEEPVIGGKEGICNVFFFNCNLQCIYCQNHQISNNQADRSRSTMNLDEVINRITGILDQGIHRVGFVSPSHVIPQVKVIIEVIENLGYKPVWVYNTNAYDKPGSIKGLEGLIDVYLPDFKYMDPALSRKFSDASDYPEIAAQSIKEMYRQKGSSLILSEDGAAESGIVIRHLILPGFIENSLDVLRYIAHEISPRLHISLMSQYYPTELVIDHPQLDRTINIKEYDRVKDEMESLQMFHGWVQELDSFHHYRPDFHKNHPFEDDFG